MSNLTNIASGCLDDELKMAILITHRSLKTCVSSHSPVQLARIADLQTWLALGFRVSHSVSPGNETQNQTSEICGQQPSKLLDKYSQVFAFSKTSQACCRLENRQWVTEQIDLFADTSELFYETFPKQGIVESNTLYLAQMMSTGSIEGNDCGSEQNGCEWLTPTASEKLQDMEKFKKRMEKYPNGTTMPSLSNQVAEFPTPQATDGTAGQVIGDNDSFFKLKDAVNLFPTVSSRDWKGGRSFEALEKSGRSENNNLNDKINALEGKIGSLNPDWTEALMMWPVSWTSLEPLTELNWDIECSEWEPDIPRVKPKEKDHANRLKAIGNGQVPLTAAIAWEILSR